MTQENLDREVPTSWKYVKLSHNRRYVHFATFKEKTDTPPGLEKLEEKGLCYILLFFLIRLVSRGAVEEKGWGQ